MNAVGSSGVNFAKLKIYITLGEGSKTVEKLRDTFGSEMY